MPFLQCLSCHAVQGVCCVLSPLRMDARPALKHGIPQWQCQNGSYESRTEFRYALLSVVGRNAAGFFVHPAFRVIRGVFSREMHAFSLTPLQLETGGLAELSRRRAFGVAD